MKISKRFKYSRNLRNSRFSQNSKGAHRTRRSQGSRKPVWVGPIVFKTNWRKSPTNKKDKKEVTFTKDGEKEDGDNKDKKNDKEDNKDQKRKGEMDEKVPQKKTRKVDTAMKHRPDFVLVYSKSALTDNSYSKIATYLVNLEQKGFEMEPTPFSINDDINFIKIYVPKNIIIHFAEVFGIDLVCQNLYFKPIPPRPNRCMATELTRPNIKSPVYKRAKETISGGPSKEVTSAEKGLIIYKVLTINAYGDEKNDCGINKLIRDNVFETAYPLHDGPYEWTEEGPLNDRQLLKRYWSSMRCWYKQQPLDIIERYYGPETAFYFAWLGFYNMMLIPASIFGLISFILGTWIFLPSFQQKSREICKSNLFLCPRCIVEHCKYGQLKNACFHAYMIHLFDNPAVVTFAALISVWSTIFIALWKRREAMLRIRWGLQSVESDYSMRPEFEEKTSYRRFSEITQTIEPYMPKRVLCCRYVITGAVLLLLLLLVILGIFGVMIYVITVTTVLTKNATLRSLDTNVGLIASSTGSCISVIFILTFELVYHRIAFWLTTLENPRTQVDFDNSYTYKSYAIAFVNNYSVIFYIAFMKARFYTYPGDKKIWENMGGIGSDLCDPAGCIIELGIQIIAILLVKNLLLTANQFILPQVLIMIQKMRKQKRKDVEVVNQWEKDYLLNAVIKYHLLEEYRQMIIQYGFVTFFVAAFPLAPLLALINNVIELRVDAFKYTSTYRRTIAFKVANIGAWDGILKGMTYIGVATNAFVIAFTSELVPRTIYGTTINSSLVGYVNYSLSAYSISEFPRTFEPHLNTSVCYYPGKRYPPDHPNKYKLTDQHWYELTMKFFTVVLFEHIVMLITGVIAYVIPEIPFSVKEHIKYHRSQVREMKLKEYDYE